VHVTFCKFENLITFYKMLRYMSFAGSLLFFAIIPNILVKKEIAMYENVKMPDGMSAEVLEHLMNPKNYGKLDSPSCVGVALDDKTKEYVIFYTLLDDKLIKDVRYATNGCQDTVVIGSMFSEMIKENDLDYANKAISKMHEKLGDMTPQQKICAEIVFSAFLASLKNLENLKAGKEEELHLFKMKDSCEAQNMQGDKDE